MLRLDEAALDGFLQDVRAGVDGRLREVLAEARAFTAEVAPETLPMFDAAAGLTFRGGKRLRPALLAAAVHAVSGGPPDDAVTELGAVLELLQTYLLVHDDWMDGDPVRRGAPSVHVELAHAYGDDGLGASAAVLAGDLMSALVHERVAALDLPTERRRAVLATFARMEREVILGQCLDVTRCADTERMHQLKTGSYTVRGPLALGVAVAGGSVAAGAALDAFATPLGAAFQLRDDVLGAFGSEAETGKPVGGDLREGKRTALVTHALAALDADRGRELEGILGRRDATDAEVARARDLLELAGAREAVEARIAEHRAAALEALATPALRDHGRSLLAGLVGRITERRR